MTTKIHDHRRLTASEIGFFPSALWEPSLTLSASLLKAKVTGLTARIALVDVGTTQLSHLASLCKGFLGVVDFPETLEVSWNSRVMPAGQFATIGLKGIPDEDGIIMVVVTE